MPKQRSGLHRVWISLTVSLFIASGIGALGTVYFYYDNMRLIDSESRNGFLSVFTGELSSFNDFLQVPPADFE